MERTSNLKNRKSSGNTSPSEEFQRITSSLEKKYSSPLIKTLSPEELLFSPVRGTNLDKSTFESISRGKSLPRKSEWGSQTDFRQESVDDYLTKSPLKSYWKTSSPTNADLTFASSVSDSFLNGRQSPTSKSQAGVIAAFRYLQDQCRNLESERAVAYAERDTLRTHLEEMYRKHESVTNQEKNKYEDDFDSMQNSNQNLQFEIKNLLELIQSMKDDEKNLEFKMYEHSEKYQYEKTQTNEQQKYLHQLYNQIQTIQNDLNESNIRKLELETKLGSIPRNLEVELFELTQAIEDIESGLIREHKRSTDILLKTDLLEKYMQTILTINGDLCESLSEQATVGDAKSPLHSIRSHLTPQSAVSNRRSLPLATSSDRSYGDADIGSISTSISKSPSKYRLRQSDPSKSPLRLRGSSSDPAGDEFDLRMSWPSSMVNHGDGSLHPNLNQQRQSDRWTLRDTARDIAHDFEDEQGGAEGAALGLSDEMDLANATASVIRSMSPKRVFVPTGKQVEQDFHLAARASKAARAAHNLTANIASRKKSLNGVYSVGSSKAIIEEIARVNEQLVNFNRLYARSP